MSDEFLSDYGWLGAHCVSHPVPDYFSGFLNDYGEFRAHCVSHRVEPKSGRHRALTFRDRLPKSPTQAIGFLLRRVLAAPLLARSAVPLSLTLRVAADPLAIAHAWVWLKPPTTDPARSLAGHHAQRRPSEVDRQF